MLLKMKSKLRHSPLFPLIRRRRFVGFGVGAPKTGTTSLAAMLSDTYATAHEHLGANTMDVVRLSRAQADQRELVKQIRWRDRELYLEFEASHLLGAVIEPLFQALPFGRFILTVREPRSWLKSTMNQHLNVPFLRRASSELTTNARFYMEVRELYHGCGTQHRPGEEALLRAGLYTLDGYLGYWARHNRRVLETIPTERLLVVRTDRLIQSSRVIADFLDLPAHTIRAERGHAHKAPKKHGMLDHVDPILVEEKLAEHCSELWERLDTLARDAAEPDLTRTRCA